MKKLLLFVCCALLAMGCGSATLNGKPLDKPFVSHETLMAGGKLVLEMGAEPNTEWGK